MQPRFPDRLRLPLDFDAQRLANRGENDRVHMVIDAMVNDWLAALFERARMPLPA